MISVAEFFKEEKDFLYIKGAVNAREKFVSNLLKKSDLSISKIAELADVSVEFVKAVKEKL